MKNSNQIISLIQKANLTKDVNQQKRLLNMARALLQDTLNSTREDKNGNK